MAYFMLFEFFLQELDLDKLQNFQSYFCAVMELLEVGRSASK